MVLMDDFLRNPRMQEERVRRFGEFVAREKAKSSPGMPDACLQCDGLGDFYGPAVFERGMHNHMWRFFDSDNPKAVLYDNEEEALAYSKRLLGQLKLFGFFDSKVWVDRVAFCMTVPHPFSRMIPPDVIVESAPRFIIRMNVK